MSVATPTRTARLWCDDVSRQFGGTRALSKASVLVADNSIVGLIGPNGAGKTTLVNVLSGQLRPTTGRILTRGDDEVTSVDITSWAPRRRWQAGIVRTFQGMRLFPNLTCYENVLTGALGSNRAAFAKSGELASSLMERFGVENLARKMPGEISIGHQKVVGVLRALVSQPNVVLLDEPLAGLAADEVERFLPILAELRDDLGVSVLIVEHNLEAVMHLADSIYVLHNGEVIAAGGAEVFDRPEVQEAYMGVQNKEMFLQQWRGEHRETNRTNQGERHEPSNT